MIEGGYENGKWIISPLTYHSIEFQCLVI